MRVIIDANNHLHRLYHAMGAQSAARYWVNMLDAICRQFVEGDRLQVHIAFDGPGGTQWRKELEPAYKGERGEKKPELIELLRGASMAATELGYEVYNIDSAEADDVVAALVTRSTDKAIMISNDKDLHQLLETGRVNQLRKFAIDRQQTVTDMVWYTQANFEAEYGIPPARWPLWKAIAGDKSDDLGGVPGCGPDVAGAFCAKYESAQAIASASPWEWPFKTQAKQNAMARAVQSGLLAKWEQVTTLRRDCLDFVLAEGGA